jgi:hypothetical protein
LNSGFIKLLVKKILLASGDREGDQGAHIFVGILVISSGFFQPWSVFSVIKTPGPFMKQKVLPSAEKVPKASHVRGRVSQISPGAKTWATGPGGIYPK